MTELKQIRSLLETHLADFRVVRTKLFGDDESEDAQGRIPRMEATAANHEKRITRIEHIGWAARGAEWLAGVIVGAVGVLYYIFGIVRH